MKTHLIFVVTLCLIQLTGCASKAWQGDLVRLAQQGRCAEAIRVVENAPIDFTEKLSFKGAVYSDCYRDKGKAFAYWTLSARYGYRQAAEFLVSYGQPVPTADLANAPQYSLTNDEAILLGIVQGLGNIRKPTYTNCHVVGNSVLCSSY